MDIIYSIPLDSFIFQSLIMMAILLVTAILVGIVLADCKDDMDVDSSLENDKVAECQITNMAN